MVTLNNSRVQFLEHLAMTSSNIVGTSSLDFLNGQTNPQDYYVYIGNSGRQAGKDLFYDSTNSGGQARRRTSIGNGQCFKY